MTNKFPTYIFKLIKKFPDILSGRKNYIEQHKRIIKTLKITRDYNKKKTNK
jgi:hypothetical protein